MCYQNSELLGGYRLAFHNKVKLKYFMGRKWDTSKSMRYENKVWGKVQ